MKCINVVSSFMVRFFRILKKMVCVDLSYLYHFVSQLVGKKWYSKSRFPVSAASYAIKLNKYDTYNYTQ